MNFLAHLYLSPNDSLVKAGNFMADWIKGRAFEEYPLKIQQGILLHRSIDEYTDTHPIVLQSKSYFREVYGKYAGVIIDMLYDHFLARYWLNYSTINLQTFSNRTFVDLLLHLNVLPMGVKKVIPKMISSNRLVSYRSLEGMRNALELMSKHTSLPAHSTRAVEIVENNYKELFEQFDTFFSTAIEHFYHKYYDLWNENNYKR